jgi:hypothetical protein
VSGTSFPQVTSRHARLPQSPLTGEIRALRHV